MVRAWIPDNADVVGEHQDCCMMVEEPSLDWLQRHVPEFHRSLSCPAMKSAHSSLQAMWEDPKNSARRSRYYLIVFPSKIDNTHFSRSSDGVVVTRDNPCWVEGNHVENSFEETIFCDSAYWDLALREGGEKLANEAADSKTRAQLLREKRQAAAAAAAASPSQTTGFNSLN